MANDNFAYLEHKTTDLLKYIFSFRIFIRYFCWSKCQAKEPCEKS